MPSRCWSMRDAPECPWPPERRARTGVGTATLTGFTERNGLGRRLPNPVTRPIEAGAADFLADKLTEVPDGLTVIALGPLTNLAMLLERHPASLEGLKSLVVMGGAVDVPGNVTTHAEFNIWERSIRRRPGAILAVSGYPGRSWGLPPGGDQP